MIIKFKYGILFESIENVFAINFCNLLTMIFPVQMLNFFKYFFLVLYMQLLFSMLRLTCSNPSVLQHHCCIHKLYACL